MSVVGMRHPRVLVGMLYSGEQEYARALNALASQHYKNHTHFVIENLPNKAAHDRLYAEFMTHSRECDYFLKLDADMVFSDAYVLQQMVETCERNMLAHLFAWVHDCPSGLDIPGIQMFASSTCWLGSEEQLNVDYAPKLDGKSAVIADRLWINHMPDPHDYQYFRYGIHKALKSLQPDRSMKDPKKGLMHLAILNGIARNARSGGPEALWLALIGATFVCRRKFGSNHYNSDEARVLFDEIKGNPEIYLECKKRAELFWANEIQVSYWWLDNFATFRNAGQ